jgi:hypothetical protein
MSLTKGTSMKTTCQKIIAIVASALLAMTAISSLQAQDTQQTTKGTRPATMTPIHSQADVDALTTGDTIAMVCGMCKSVTLVTYSSDADSKGHVKWMHPGSEMNCPQCGGKMTTNGGGTGKQAGYTHTCTKCGGESAFCCATKKG